VTLDLSDVQWFFLHCPTMLPLSTFECQEFVCRLGKPVRRRRGLRCWNDQAVVATLMR
jgi:hypothetical protein